MTSIKALLQKIASWFKREETAVVAKMETVATDAETIITKVTTTVEKAMPDATVATTSTAGNNVVTALQIALALKAIDPALSDAAVQAATQSALASAYPVVAAA